MASLPLLPDETSIASVGEVRLTQKRVIGPSNPHPDGYTAILIQDVVSCSVATRRPALWVVLLGILGALGGVAGYLRFSVEPAGWFGLLAGIATLVWYRDQTADVLTIRAANGEIGQRISEASPGADELVNRIQSAKLNLSTASTSAPGVHPSFASSR